MGKATVKEFEGMSLTELIGEAIWTLRAAAEDMALPEHCAALAALLEAGGARETQASVSTWAEETFGPSGSNARAAARANEEMAELLAELTKEEPDYRKVADELADIVIVLYRVATKCEVGLMAEIDRKMAINRAREWRHDGSGHGYHV